MSGDLYTVQIAWTDGSHPTTLTLDNHQIGDQDFNDWLRDFVTNAIRPRWIRLGDLVFFTQNVRSIELVETFKQEG